VDPIALIVIALAASVLGVRALELAVKSPQAYRELWANGARGFAEAAARAHERPRLVASSNEKAAAERAKAGDDRALAA
jgi:hypothetical protein